MSEDDIDLDAALDLCRDRHRRIVLATLADRRRPVTLTDLATVIVECDRQASVEEIPDETLARIRCSLYHVHVPKLEAAGVVDTDPERERVEPAEEFDRLQPVLSAIVEADPALEPPIEP